MKKFYFLTLFAMLFCCLGMHAAAELTFSNVSLAPNSKVEAITQDQQITFNTNMDAEIGYMYAELKDKTKDEVVLSRVTVYDPNFNNDGSGTASNMPQNKKDPHFTFVCPSTTTLTEGHTYSLIFYAFEDKDASHGSAESVLATGTIEYEGATEAYIPSPFKLLSITPDPKTYVISSAENRSATLTFNTKVRLDKNNTFVNTGNGSSAPFESITPGADAETVITKVGDDVVSEYVYSSSWTLTPKESTISDGSDVIFVANAFDKSGLHVAATAIGLEKYTTGNTESGYYSFTMMNDLGRETFTITPAEDNEYVNSLYSFKVQSGSAGISAAGISEPAVVYQVGSDGSKTEVAKVAIVVDDVVKAGDPSKYQDELTLSQRVFLDKQITKAGTYILHFPRGYFNIGTGATAGAAGTTDFTYTIKADFTPATAKVMGATEVKKLAKVEVQYPDYDMVAPCGDSDQQAYILDQNNNLVTKASLESCWDYDEYANVIDVKLKTPVTTPGAYKLIIPQDAVCVEAMEEEYAKATKSAKGGYNPSDDFEPEYTLLGAFVQEFTVVPGSAEGVTTKLDIESGSTVAKLDAVKITFESETSEDLVLECTQPGQSMTLWRGDNNKLFATDASIDGNVATIKPFTSGRKKDTYGITAAGTYTVTLPEGFFTVNGVDWPAMTLTYTVDPTLDSISNVEGEASNTAKSTYTLTGVKVNGENAKNGVFIVNGKKVILK